MANLFPITLKNGETIFKIIKIGGLQGNTAKLDMSIRMVKINNKYIVTLTKNYNITENGTLAMSTWKYEVDRNNIKLVGSNEQGNLVRIIK